jgi:hypothetical protein
MSKFIYYTGIGAKKSGKHSTKDFLNIMNKKFNIKCSEFLPEIDYKPCFENKSKELYMNLNKTKKNTRKYKNFKNQVNQCKKYIKTAKKRKCNLDEYIKFSGAENNN